MDFQELAKQHGGAERIPHDVLYAELRRLRPDLINRASKLGTEQITQTPLGQEVRRRAKSDLFFLARYFCWETNSEGADKPIEENAILAETHGRMCSLFVRKDDSKSIAAQDPYKHRVLLWPRGGLKSTIDVLDGCQWLLNFPDIRILYLTAEDDLAKGFVKETKGHFLIHERPTFMNLFFPEFCVADGRIGNEFEFNCPVWSAKKIFRKEASVTASSIGSTNAGRHYEVMKADDAVSEINSQSDEQCKKVTKFLELCRKMLRPWGYYDQIGTRYSDDDDYGVTLEKNVGDVVTTQDGPCVQLFENRTTASRILIGKAIVVKPDVAKRLETENKPVNYLQAGEEGCDLLVPHIWTYPKLMQDYTRNEETFESQLNQNPRPASTVLFDQPLLRRATIEFNQMPFHGPISQIWDFAFSKKKKRDYSTGCAVIWNDKGEMHLHDLVRGRFKHTDLAHAVVDFARKYHPFVIGVEKAAGSDFLEPTIIQFAKETGDEHVIKVCSHIDWITPDNQVEAKKIRMAALHPWLLSGRLKFASYLPYLDTLYSEFERCLTSHHHDDIPDVISYQPRYAPRMQQLIDKKEIQTWSRVDAAWNLMFEENVDAFGRIGLGGPSPIPVVQITPEPEIRGEAPEGLESILGAGLFG